MKKITAFYLEGCPYCKQARKALDELKADAKYGAVSVDWIEEKQHPDVAEKYDYYNVPTMFVDGEKLYEAKPGEKYDDCKAHVKQVLDEALS